MARPRSRFGSDANLSGGSPWATAGRGILFLHLLLVPLIFSRQTVEAFEFPKVHLLYLTAILLGTLGLSALVWRGRHDSPAAWLAAAGTRARSLPRDPIALGFCLFLLSATASTAGSISPRISLRGMQESYAGLFTILSYTVLFFATRILCREAKACRRLLTAAAAASAIAAGYALLQAIGLDPWPWDDVSGLGTYRRPFGTMGHANLLAAFLVMSLPLTLWLAAQAYRAGRRTITATWLAAATLEILCVVLCLSRGAWLALAAALAVLGMGWARRFSWRRAVPLAWLAVPVAILGFALHGRAETELTSRLADRVRHWSQSESRLHIWRAGWQMFRDRPWLGYGLDTFQLAYPHYRTAASWRSEWNVTPARAHNEAIHILATQGATGGAAAIFLTLGLAAAGLRAWRSGDAADPSLAAAAAAGIVAFYVQDLFSFTVAGCGSLFVVLAGMLPRPTQCAVAAPSRIRGGPVSHSWMLPLAAQAAVAAMAGCLAARVVVEPVMADLACAAGGRLLDSAPGRALPCFERAVAWAPGQDIYWAGLGGAALAAANEQTPGALRRQLLQQAQAAFERALVLVPRAGYHHDNLAQARTRGAIEDHCSPAAALREYDAAIACDPANVYYIADAARAALMLGDPARARRYARYGLQAYPEFAPLQATLAYAAMLEGQPNEGTRLLQTALAGNWFGDESARRNAARALERLSRPAVP